METKQIFSLILSRVLNQKIVVHSIKSLSGGCIHNAMNVETNNGSFFIKVNSTANYKMFETEAKGLQLLGQSGAIHVPKVISYGQEKSLSYLILEFIESGRRNDNYWEDFGNSLSQLHRNTSDTNGLDHDNFIGSLPQINSPEKSWINFFIDNRLRFQQRLALEEERIDSSLSEKLEKLYLKLPQLLHEGQPSLLHGDLWSGNVLVNKEGKVTIIDPAVFYGHREAEMAFTTLFGGFDQRFYDSYNASYPLFKGYRERFDLYNLYPLLVHVNLFGGGYVGSISKIINKYV